MKRRDFDIILGDFFPGAITSREEFRSGWMDTIEIGDILIEIAALHTSPKGSAKKTGIYAYIKARSDTQGKTLIWRASDHPCNTTALRIVLGNLKKNLLGMSAAINQMCGFIDDIGIKQEEFIDVDDFINDRRHRAKEQNDFLDGLLSDNEDDFDCLD